MGFFEYWALAWQLLAAAAVCCIAAYVWVRLESWIEAPMAKYERDLTDPEIRALGDYLPDNTNAETVRQRRMS